jgi:hypothetical protein
VSCIGVESNDEIAPDGSGMIAEVLKGSMQRGILPCMSEISLRKRCTSNCKSNNQLHNIETAINAIAGNDICDASLNNAGDNNSYYDASLDDSGDDITANYN